MYFNPQERLTILNGDDRDTIYKCIEIAKKKISNSRQVLLYDLIGLSLSLNSLNNAQIGHKDNFMLEFFEEDGEHYIDKFIVIVMIIVLKENIVNMYLQLNFVFMQNYIKFQQNIIFQVLNIQQKRLKSLQDMNT